MQHNFVLCFPCSLGVNFRNNGFFGTHCLWHTLNKPSIWVTDVALKCILHNKNHHYYVDFTQTSTPIWGSERHSLLSLMHEHYTRYTLRNYLHKWESFLADFRGLCLGRWAAPILRWNLLGFAACDVKLEWTHQTAGSARSWWNQTPVHSQPKYSYLPTNMFCNQGIISIADKDSQTYAVKWILRSGSWNQLCWSLYACSGLNWACANHMK